MLFVVLAPTVLKANIEPQESQCADGQSRSASLRSLKAEDYHEDNQRRSASARTRQRAPGNGRDVKVTVPAGTVAKAIAGFDPFAFTQKDAVARMNGAHVRGQQAAQRN